MKKPGLKGFTRIVAALMVSLMSFSAVAEKTPEHDIEDVLGEKSFWKIDTEKTKGHMGRSSDVSFRFILKGDQDDHPVYQSKLIKSGRAIGKEKKQYLKPYMKETDDGVFFEYSGHDTFSNSREMLISYNGDQLMLKDEKRDEVVYLDEQDEKPEKPSCEDRDLSEMECLKEDNPKEYYKRMKEQNRKQR